MMCAAERRSSLPAVRASRAASSEGLRSILSHTRGCCRKLTLCTVTKLRTRVGDSRFARTKCSKNSAEAPQNTVHQHNGHLQRRHILAYVAHLVIICCEWYWLVLRGEWGNTDESRPGTVRPNCTSSGKCR
eukprot:1463239-Rhodomonas_salina.1